jgi:hypothetical protein
MHTPMLNATPRCVQTALGAYGLNQSILGLNHAWPKSNHT